MEASRGRWRSTRKKAQRRLRCGATDGPWESDTSIMYRTMRFWSRSVNRDCYWKRQSRRNYGTLDMSHAIHPCKIVSLWDSCLGGQRRQWTDDITDWAGLNLPEVVTLANERRQYRQLVRKIVKASRGVWLGTNLIHGENAWFHGMFLKIRPISRKIHGRSFRNSRAPHTLFRGAMLMQTKKSVE